MHHSDTFGKKPETQTTMARPGRPNKLDPRFEPVPSLIQSQDNEEVKKILLETGIDAGDSYLRTALILATLHKNSDLLRWLIDKQANIDQQDRNGYSALHFAAQERNEVAARILFDNGANPNPSDIHGNTPLWTAIFNARGDFQLVKLYLQKGANPDSVNNYQKTPREMAKTIGEVDLDNIP